MRAIITGDFVRLAAIERALGRVASGEVRRAAARAMGAAGLAEARRGFALGESPEGSPWTPSKKRGGRTLVRTGALRDGLSVLVNAYGFTLLSRRPYAGVHQEGFPARNLPARPFLPGDELGSRWTDALEDAAAAAMDRALAGV